MSMTRRDFILTSGVGMAGTIIASPVRSNCGSRETLSRTVPYDPYSARNYLQDGLIGHWDGIENGGYGVHDSTQSIWCDLVGGNHLVKSGSSNIFVHADGFKWVNIKQTYLQSLQRFYGLDTTGYTFEILAEAYTHSNLCNDMLSFQYNTYNYGFSIFWYNQYTPYGYKITYDQPDRYTGIMDSAGITSYSRVVYPNRLGREDFINAVQLRTVTSTQMTSEGAFLSVGALRPDFMTGRVSGNFKIYCIRLYNRMLTETEVTYNHTVDKVRFGF